MRAISNSSACSGLPSIDPSMASGSRMKRGECSTMIVCCAARPGAISLRPPEKPEHPMRLDEAERDVQIRIQEAAVDVDRRSAGGRAQRAMVPQRARVVVDDAIAPGDLRAEDRVDLFAGRAAMQAGPQSGS